MAAITGGTGGLASYFTAKLNGKYGRNVAIAIALCLDISNYFLSLFWVPNEESLWVAYIVFVFYGLSNGTWQALVNGNSRYVSFCTKFFLLMMMLFIKICYSCLSLMEFSVKGK